jgi:predicted nucleotidyltransferase
MRLTPAQIDAIKSTVHAVLISTSGLAFAVLVGSRAEGTARQDSDWDIAIQWSTRMLSMDKLGTTEELRQSLCRALQVADSQIDLFDLSDARLTMRALVAEEGVPLWISDDLAWVRFLQNTWAQLEDNQWRKQHTASCMTT